MNRLLLPFMIAVAGSLIGCGSSPPPAPPVTNSTSPAVTNPPAVDTPQTKVNEKPVEPQVPVVVKIDENSAASAVQSTLKALEAGDLAEAYEFLPDKYQADIDSLVHDFADKMDAEVWTRLTATIRKCIDVLRARKDSVLALDLFRNRPEADLYRKHWDSTLTVLGTFAASDATNLAKLKQMSVRSLLEGKGTPGLQDLDAIGRSLGASLATQFAGVTVTPVRTIGEEQVLAFKGPNDEKPIEVTYVKVDGRWLPKSLVEHWDEGIAADRAWLEKLPDRIKAVKPRLLDALSETDEVLDRLQAAENREQFEQAAGPAILMLAMAWPNLQALARQATSGTAELPQVTIVINRELTDADLGKLTATVLTPLRESGSDYTLLANNGQTVCRVVRVNDLIALQASLATHFRIPAAKVEFRRDMSTLNVSLAP